MAGAVMVKLGESRPGRYPPSVFDTDTSIKLVAIDSLRKGPIYEALSEICRPTISYADLHGVLSQEIVAKAADHSLSPWSHDWAAHRALARELKRLDL